MTTTTLTTTIRPATPDDAERCGGVMFDAFESIAVRHGFPIEPGSPEFTRMKMAELLGTDGLFGLVAERGGETVGLAVADERSPVAGIGPVAVAPGAQDAGIGRTLVGDLLARERERGAVGVRLVQTAYHYRSLALYASLGFAVREPLCVVQGTPPALSLPGRGVRAARADDVPACDALCARVHGHARSEELRAAIAAGTAVVVERPEALTGYATSVGYGGHAVAETDEDVEAILACAPAFLGLGVLVPARNAGLLGWCLAHGLRIVQTSMLMTIGLYNEPRGAWLPSIVY